jgi:hypothetical protein
MNLVGPDFIIAIIAISTAGWVINNWIRARHGYALEDEWGGKTRKADEAATQQLKAENAEQRELLSHFADRVKVLERIVTDKGYDVASQIEALRDTGKTDAQPVETNLGSRA